VAKREMEDGDLRLEFGRAEDAAILGGVKPPKVPIAQHDNVTIATGVTYFRVRHTPVKALGTRHACAVEHPPSHVPCTQVNRMQLRNAPICVHAERGILGAINRYLTTL
jgi:hypothetical protein